MCGRYSLVSTENIATRFSVTQEQGTFLPRYNAAPQQTMPVIIDGSQPRLMEMRWGLIPAWSKEPRVAFSTINARAETVTTSPTFRKAFKSQRCLVPATGFYEWQKTGKGKQPYCFQLHGGELFAFAGLYDIWRDDDENELYSFTIITTDPNPLVAPIHNRMPVVLRRDDELVWLNPKAAAAHLKTLLTPYPADEMELFAVSRAVNNPANQDATLIQPLKAA
jgi:putative SOS response-associated peptidase YedK